jgi:hypothetical protein
MTRAAKISPANAIEIREKYAQGWTQGRLSREFKLSVGQIGRIVRGESWQQFGLIRTSHEQQLDIVLAESAMKAEPTAESIASEAELRKRLAGLKAPEPGVSWYDLPPPEVPGEPTGSGLEKLKELTKPTELDKEFDELMSDEVTETKGD